MIFKRKPVTERLCYRTGLAGFLITVIAVIADKVDGLAVAKTAFDCIDIRFLHTKLSFHSYASSMTGWAWAIIHISSGIAIFLDSASATTLAQHIFDSIVHYGNGLINRIELAIKLLAFFFILAKKYAFLFDNCRSFLI